MVCVQMLQFRALIQIHCEQLKAFIVQPECYFVICTQPVIVFIHRFDLIFYFAFFPREFFELAEVFLLCADKSTERTSRSREIVFEFNRIDGRTRAEISDLESLLLKLIACN